MEVDEIMRAKGAGEREMVGEGAQRKVEKKKRKKNKKKKKKDGDPPNPPEVDVSILQQELPPQDLAPQFRDNENPNPDQFAPVPPIPKEIPPAPHDNKIRDPQPPPIPPMPKGYKKTSIKDLEKKHKEVKKTIKKLEKELDKLYIEKIHLDRCIGYFNDDSEDFIRQINPPSPPPDDPSPPPPPIPPRPQEHQKSFVEHLGSALFSAIPRQEQWTSSVRTHQFAFECDQRGERVERHEDPPLPESFTLFREHTPSSVYNPPEYRSPSPPPPPTPSRPWSTSPKPERHGQCYCYDCVHGHPHPKH